MMLSVTVRRKVSGEHLEYHAMVDDLEIIDGDDVEAARRCTGILLAELSAAMQTDKNMAHAMLIRALKNEVFGN